METNTFTSTSQNNEMSVVHGMLAIIYFSKIISQFNIFNILK
jgi:hypothetical protein